MSYNEKLFYNLNTAFSLNFMVLQNLARLLPSGNNTVFTRDDIFGEKSSAKQHYEMYFEDLAEIRNDYFAEIRSFFSPETYFESFKTNTKYMLDEYNDRFEKKVSYSDIFSDRNVKNWEAFNKLFDNIENYNGQNSMDRMKLQFAFAQFLTFYDDYKEWLSAYEIFEVLESDITSYGSKSFYHGITQNQDVLTIHFDDYHNYSEKIVEFLENYNKKSKNKKNKSSEQKSVEQLSLDSIINFYNNMEDRFGHANSHLMEIGNIWSRIAYKFSHMSDGDFEVHEVYIHKNEILRLISALAEFPELHELANTISLKFLGLNVDFSQNKEKENS